jgi:Glycosyltransferase like family
MSAIEKLTFAAAVNDRKIFASNFLISPIFKPLHPHQILVQSGFASAAKAYNDAIDRSDNEIIVFCHQDMIFPAGWLLDLERALEYLDRTDPNWGVLGTFGETADAQGRGYVYMPGLGTIGALSENPERVQTLDEIVLVIRKSSGLRFDSTLPHFHFYGVDLCLQAADRHMNSYAIPAFCIHNTQYNLVLPPEFYACYHHVKKRWKKYLPIQTTCVRITKFDLDMTKRRLRELYLSKVKGRRVGAQRFQDTQQLLETIGDRHGISLESSLMGK